MPGGNSYIGALQIVESTGEITSQAIGDKALKSTCADDTSIEVSSSTGQLQLKDAGTSKANGLQRAQSSKYAGFWIKGALVASDSAGGVFAEENTYGSDLVVTRALLAVTTQSSGACTLDVGVAADGTTLDDDIIDGLSVAAAGVFDNITDNGTNGKSRQKWASGQFLTGSVASGASSGLVGTYAIHCLDIIS